VPGAYPFEIPGLALPLQSLGIIAGNGVYPRLMAQAARKAGVNHIAAVAFHNETDPSLAQYTDSIEWLRVGQLARLLKVFRDQDVHHAVMAGQIAPRNLFDLRPDFKALLILAKLKQRNAETIFSAIADELKKAEVELLPATSFLEDQLANSGLMAGPRLSRRQEQDVEVGWRVAKEIARMDVGQTVIVRHGTVLAMEGFDGTNETIRRGGALARKGAVMVKVAKPKQDMRFDVPVVGVETLRISADANVRVIAVEASMTLLLERDAVLELADRERISLVGR
jgi:DUF1009 family protein